MLSEDGRYFAVLGLMAKNCVGGVMIIQKLAGDAPDPLPPYGPEMRGCGDKKR